MYNTEWHASAVVDVCNTLHTDGARGLTERDVRERMLKYGPNALSRTKQFRIARIIFAQLISPLAIVLILAGVATFILGEILDTVVIVLALFVNVAVGAFQEGRASKVFDALAASQEVSATVVRDGVKHVIPAHELVPGDLVILATGKAVPADLRLSKAKGLAINEAALTGEWLAVAKSDEVLAAGVTLSEQTNMAWSGTIVTEGFGEGIVVATGSQTKLGSIAHDTEEAALEVTPLQQSMKRIARIMLMIIAVAIALIVAAGLFRGEPLTEMILVAIAVAVAAMPEGLPAAVTVVLAVGMEAILRKGGLVKSLLAAETLGSTTVILTDKTGTLTKGNMAVAGYYTVRAMHAQDTTLSHDDNNILLRSAILASDAFTEERDGMLVVEGRPIERAIVHAGLAAGISQPVLFAEEYARVDFLAFDSARRFAASMNNHPEGRRVYFSGAPEELLSRSSFCMVAGTKREIDEEIREQFMEMQRVASAQGERFIAIAYRADVGARISDDVRKGDADGLIFVGLLAFADEVRADVSQEIRVAKEAGVQVIMVTGDYPETARAIAIDVGIAEEGADVVTGKMLEEMDDQALLEALRKHTVFARVLPEQKLRLVRVLRNAGEVVAMTGDGVNDAPALVAADIGVAVGSGTDVAKEASDIVLIDSTFNTITAAIKEGRRIVDNLRKIIGYLLATSFSEIIVIGGALVVGAPLPLLPAQILWANIIEEGLMSFPFAFDPARRDVMKRSPRRLGLGLVLSRDMYEIIAIATVVTGVLLLGLFFYLRSIGLPIEEIRTVMFVALSLDSIFFAFSFKNLSRPLWHTDITNNYLLFVSLGTSILLLIAAITVPPLMTLLSLTPLSFFDVMLLVGVGIANLLTIELSKYVVMLQKKEKDVDISTEVPTGAIMGNI